VPATDITRREAHEGHHEQYKDPSTPEHATWDAATTSSVPIKDCAASGENA
jgi:hypothetical protein